MRICKICEQEKEESDFRLCYSTKKGVKYSYRLKTCTLCERISQTLRFELNKDARKETIRVSNLRRRYKLTDDEYNALLESQDGRCAICKELPTNIRLCVDHNHKTGKVRGLLCHTCNRAIGLLKDSPTLLSTALSYLESS